MPYILNILHMHVCTKPNLYFFLYIFLKPISKLHSDSVKNPFIGNQLLSYGFVKTLLTSLKLFGLYVNTQYICYRFINQSSKKITMRAIKNLTELEKQVLQCIADCMYAEWGFSDIGATDVARETGIETKVVRGVISSLVKKKLVQVEDRTDHVGYRANDPSWEPIIYLDNEAQGLVEHWVENNEGELEASIIE